MDAPITGLTRPRRRLLWSVVVAVLGALAGWMLLGRSAETWMHTTGISGVRSDTFGLFAYLTRQVEPVTADGRRGPGCRGTLHWNRPGLFMTALAGGGVAVALAGTYRYGVARHLPPGRCDECGYDLRGRPAGPCPECGADIAAPCRPSQHNRKPAGEGRRVK